METLTWSDAWYLAPEITLSAFAIVLCLLDLFLPKSWNRNLIGWLTILGLVSAAAFVVWLIVDLKNAASPDNPLSSVHNMIALSYRIDNFGSLLKLVFLGSSAFIVLASLGTVRSKDIPTKGEFYYFILPAALGAMVMASSADLITLFVGLELLGITTYLLVAMRKRSGLSSEAAFKYYVTGGVASAFILYGMSFLYGVTGSTVLPAIGGSIGAAVGDYRALIYVAFFLMLAGFAMKLALAPFHAWAADVYQGAPTPVTSFLAVVSKGAAFAMLYRIFANAIFFTDLDPQVRNDVYLALAVLAAAAMIVGTAGALRQRNVKRLLALSGVANAGILLIPLSSKISALHTSLFSEFVYFLLAYAFMNIGAFAVLTVVSRGTGNETLSGFAGLYYRAPWTAAGMTVLLCSLAGLPVTGGFFGKLYILFGTVQMGAYWLAAILLVTTIVSYAVYFSFIRQMYMRSGSDDSVIRIPVPAAVSIWICVAATLALGFLPKPVLGWINSLFSIGADFLAR